VPGPDAPLLASALRKQPAQRRSMERVSLILDAAGELVAKQGYGGITTSLIARHAGVPPGTLYEFFVDKRAVLQAVAARNLERFDDRVSKVLDAHPPRDLREASRLILDIYIEMNRRDVRFRAVRFGDVVEPHLFDPELENDALVAARYAAFLSRIVDVSDTPELHRALVFAAKMVDVLIDYAFSLDEDGDPWVLDRTRLLVDEHLARVE
jgi:AcrR family transcriptional regulator